MHETDHVKNEQTAPEGQECSVGSDKCIHMCGKVSFKLSNFLK